MPSSLGNLRSLSTLNLESNKISGTLPREVGNLTELTALYLSDNHMQGPLPSELGNCHNLLVLDLSFNSLNGTIPASLSSLKSLTLLDLRENRFIGGIPPFLSELQSLRELQLGGNLLRGPIPSSITSLTKLMYSLNLSNNGLTGVLPSDLWKLNELQNLDVSSNNLTGSLATLDNMPALVEVNVSHNHFFGPIPPRLLKILGNSPTSFSWNSELCVDMKSKYMKTCEARSIHHKRRLHGIHIALIAIGTSLFALLASFSVCYIFLRRQGRSQTGVEIQGREGSGYSINKIMECTENLSEEYIIGRGAHGTVYKAPLGGPQKVFAVKKIVFSDHGSANMSMVREIQTLGKIKHRNLVKLRDFWLLKDYGVILYDYMENGSLHDILHRKSPLAELPWKVRYRIALGTAQGLSYLHFDADPAILHRDIKPDNILLDADMEPHISDFGIAKLLDQSAISTQSIAVPGTVGYIAPENAFATTRSQESDVYSYGVVLLELLTRKKAVDASFPEGIDLVGWVRSVWSCSEQIEKLIDGSLQEEFMEPMVMEQVYEVFFVALRCTEREPAKRPNMRDVVKTLEDAKDRKSVV